jgi:hypothetical protein
MSNRRAWLAVVVLGSIFATNASAQSQIDKLRGCLTIEDASKERLDCYDGVVPPVPKPKPPTAKVVADCKFLKEEDERLGCFNRFVTKPAQPAAVPKGAPKVQPSK